jgi:hypothetical protein
MNETIYEEFEKLCEQEDYNKIKEYLTKYEGLANERYFFADVADKGNLELIKLFVEHGTDINKDNNYILFTCSYHRYIDCLEYLISKGAKANNIKGTCGYSFLSLFINGGQT